MTRARAAPILHRALRGGEAKVVMRVMNDFSPLLTEKFVWKLNMSCARAVLLLGRRAAIIKARVGHGALSRQGLAMQPSVFVPTERPPPLRLYMVTQGVAIHKGKSASPARRGARRRCCCAPAARANVTAPLRRPTSRVDWCGYV